MEKNRITQSIIIAATTLIAAFAWETLKNFLLLEGSWMWPSISFLILLIFLSLTWVLSESKAISLINLAVIHVSFLFVFGIKLGYLPVLFISFALFLFGAYRAMDEKNARLKIQIFSILKKGLPVSITGLVLIIAAAYYFSPLGQQGHDQIMVPEPLFNIMADPLLNNLEKQIPISEGSLPEGVDIDSSDRGELKEMLYLQLNQEINKYSQQYQDYIPIGLSIGVFFALKTIGFFCVYLIILLAFVIFKILVHFGAVKIQEQSVLKQVIDL